MQADGPHGAADSAPIAWDDPLESVAFAGAVLDAFDDLFVLVVDTQLVVRAVRGGLRPSPALSGGAVGQPLHALLSDFAWGLLELRYRRMLSGEAQRTDFPTREGASVFDAAFRPIVGADGTVRGGVVVARDVSELRRLQAALTMARGDEAGPRSLTVRWESATLDIQHGGSWARLRAPSSGVLTTPHRRAATALLRAELQRSFLDVRAVVLYPDERQRLVVEVAVRSERFADAARRGELAALAAHALAISDPVHHTRCAGCR